MLLVTGSIAAKMQLSAVINASQMPCDCCTYLQYKLHLFIMTAVHHCLVELCILM